MAADVLYIGDALSDSVQKFNANTGAYLGSLVTSGSGGLHGPNGMVLDQESLLVINQNVDLPINGEVLRYNAQTGAPAGALVPTSNADAPFSPAGIVVRNNIAYVADTRLDAASGRIAMYDATTGAFQGDLVPRESVPNAFEDPFRPRGLAFGPRDELYVSVFNENTFATDDPAGYILAFDVDTGDYRVVAFNDGDGEVTPGEVTDLHNPEGLVVGPDGCLYVTSSRRNPDDTDKVLCVDPIAGGAFGWRSIPLDEPGGPRAFAQSILFGPDGKLFVPITGGGPDAGSVRRYDINSGEFDIFTPSADNGGVLTTPMYATFGRTDAATLDYQDPPTLSGIETSPAVVEGGPLPGSGPRMKQVSESIQVADLDGFVNGASVRITGNYRSDQDSLSAGFNNGGIISSSWDATSGTLTLAGRDQVDSYRLALQNIVYTNSSATPDLVKRTVSFTVNDSPTDSNTLSRDILLLKDDLNALFYMTRFVGAGRTMDALLRLDTNTGELSFPYFVPGHEEGAILLANGTKLLAASRNIEPFTGGGEGEEGSFFVQSKERGAVIRFPDFGTVIADDSASAPIDPEGMLLDGNTLYVADTRSSLPGVAPVLSGRILRYNATTGEFLNEITANGFAGLFHPRGLVFGPDGSLYVTLYDPNVDANGDQTNPGYGAILKFDTVSPAPVVVAFNNGDALLDTGETANLHNPGSLVFGPDGKLYVTTRSPDPDALDKILVLDPANSFAQVDQIDIIRVTDLPLHPRAMLFGPDDKLLVSVNEPDDPDPFGRSNGFLRSYDVTSHEFTVTAKSESGPIGYFTFGYTNPKTLAFEPPAGAAPMLGGIEATRVELFTNTATQVTATLSVGDSDSALLSGATVTIASGYDHDRDALTFIDTANINGIWNPSTGTLRLIGTDSVTNYQAALRSVKFENDSPFGATPLLGKRTVTLQVTDGDHTSNAVTRDVRVSLIRGDYLYIGDQGTEADETDDTIKQFDVQATNSLFDTIGAPGQLVGPRGMVLSAGNLLAVNQNVNQPFAGEVLRFNGWLGTDLPPLVPAADTQAPFAPRGIVLKDDVLYVADFVGSDTPRIAKYNATTGTFIGDLRPSNFAAPFNPRGLVFGPDDKLYVTVYSADENVVRSDDPSGYVLKFLDTTTGAFEVVASNNGDASHTAGEIADLHNPEGIVFGPDGRLYVTSFGFGAVDNGIVVLDVATKQQVDYLSLGENFSLALLFGPDDLLFATIQGGPDAGSVRAYDLQGNFNSFVAPTGSTLTTPWYMTFTQTNPATLAYEPWHNFVNPLDVDGDGHVVPLDVLLIINEIDAPKITGSSSRLPRSRPAGGFYFDVNQDGFLAPIDALNIINFLDGRPPQEGESEQIPVTAALTQIHVRFASDSPISLPQSSLSRPVLPTPFAPSEGTSEAVAYESVTARSDSDWQRFTSKAIKAARSQSDAGLDDVRSAETADAACFAVANNRSARDIGA